MRELKLEEIQNVSGGFESYEEYRNAAPGWMTEESLRRQWESQQALDGISSVVGFDITQGGSVTSVVDNNSSQSSLDQQLAENASEPFIASNAYAELASEIDGCALSEGLQNIGSVAAIGGVISGNGAVAGAGAIGAGIGTIGGNLGDCD